MMKTPLRLSLYRRSITSFDSYTPRASRSARLISATAIRNSENDASGGDTLTQLAQQQAKPEEKQQSEQQAKPEEKQQSEQQAKPEEKRQAQEIRKKLYPLESKKPAIKPSQLQKSWDRPKTKLAGAFLNRQAGSAPSKAILIEHLPPSVIPGDIRFLANKVNPILAENIQEVSLWRNHFFHLTGKAGVLFASESDAENFLKGNTVSFVGGHRVTMQFCGLKLYHGNRVPELVEAPGQWVELSGLPANLEHRHLVDMIQNFSIENRQSTGVQLLRSPDREITSKWLVKATSVPAAHRIARELHNRYYQPGEFLDPYVIRARVVY